MKTEGKTMRISKETADKLRLMHKRYLTLRASYREKLGSRKITRERYFQLIEADKRGFKEYVKRTLSKEGIPYGN